MTSDSYAGFTDPGTLLREALDRIATLHRDVRGECRECENLWPCMTNLIAAGALR